METKGSRGPPGIPRRSPSTAAVIPAMIPAPSGGFGKARFERRPHRQARRDAWPQPVTTAMASGGGGVRAARSPVITQWTKCSFVTVGRFRTKG